MFWQRACGKQLKNCSNFTTADQIVWHAINPSEHPKLRLFGKLIRCQDFAENSVQYGATKSGLKSGLIRTMSTWHISTTMKQFQGYRHWHISRWPMHFYSALQHSHYHTIYYARKRFSTSQYDVRHSMSKISAYFSIFSDAILCTVADTSQCFTHKYKQGWESTNYTAHWQKTVHVTEWQTPQWRTQV